MTPDETPCIMSDSPENPKKNREKITEIVFETLNVPEFFLANSAVLALYASGRTSGLLLDSGA